MASLTMVEDQNLLTKSWLVDSKCVFYLLCIVLDTSMSNIWPLSCLPWALNTVQKSCAYAKCKDCSCFAAHCLVRPTSQSSTIHPELSNASSAAPNHAAGHGLGRSAQHSVRDRGRNCTLAVAVRHWLSQLAVDLGRKPWFSTSAKSIARHCCSQGGWKGLYKSYSKYNYKTVQLNNRIRIE